MDKIQIPIGILHARTWETGRGFPRSDSPELVTIKTATVYPHKYQINIDGHTFTIESLTHIADALDKIKHFSPDATLMGSLIEVNWYADTVTINGVVVSTLSGFGRWVDGLARICEENNDSH